MDYSRFQPLRQSGYAEHRATVIEKLDNIPMMNAPGLCIFRMYPGRTPIVSIFIYAMAWNIFQPGYASVVMGMEGVAGVGRNELERILFE
jgi:hypothetical protein